MKPMSGARMEGRMYPGQWALGNVLKSSGRAGIPKAWSKIRLCWCQSRNGSQLGVRIKVKGIRLSVMAAAFRRLRSTSESEVLDASQLRAFMHHPSQQSPPICTSPPSSPLHMFVEWTRSSISSNGDTLMEFRPSHSQSCPVLLRR